MIRVKLVHSNHEKELKYWIITAIIFAVVVFFVGGEPKDLIPDGLILLIIFIYETAKWILWKLGGGFEYEIWDEKIGYHSYEYQGEQYRSNDEIMEAMEGHINPNQARKFR